MNTRSARTLILSACLLLSGAALAHGDGPTHGLPPDSVKGMERGIDLALNCDHAIHEILDEYNYCMRANHERIVADPEAETAFRFMAWLRAATAQYHGYPDGAQYKAVYRESFLAAQRVRAIAPAKLCKAINIDCAGLPEPVPEPVPQGR